VEKLCIIGLQVLRASQDVIDGKYRIILISPESLLSRRIIDGLLRNQTFTRSVLSVAIDEAHCVSFWSNSFRKKYGALHIVRQFLPRQTPVIALSATLTPRVQRDLVPKLNLSSNHVLINEGNNKPNLTIAVLRCRYSLKSLLDLTFVIPDSTFHPLDIPKTLLYADNIDLGRQIVQFLTSLLPEHLRGAGIIRPYNSRHTRDYLAQAMRHLRDGNIRVLVCTDAAGMVSNTFL
jgi:superfamily II DNA helicase RecQ